MCHSERFHADHREDDENFRMPSKSPRPPTKEGFEKCREQLKTAQEKISQIKAVTCLGSIASPNPVKPVLTTRLLR